MNFLAIKLIQGISAIDFDQFNHLIKCTLFFFCQYLAVALGTNTCTRRRRESTLARISLASSSKNCEKTYVTCYYINEPLDFLHVT